MFVKYDDTADRSPKSRPQTSVSNDSELRHWDFCEHPDLIPKVLEDFVPWDHYPAVQKFYNLLRWLNGEESIFASNSCALAVPKTDTLVPQLVSDSFAAEPIAVHGRLSIVYRDLSWNADRRRIEWLKRTLHDRLRDQGIDLPAMIYIGERDCLFSAIKSPGHAVTLRYWAWGGDEMAAMQNLEGTFAVLHALLPQLSTSAKQHLHLDEPDPAGTTGN